MPSISPEDLSRLLLTLYSAPCRPELWSKFLEEFVTLLGISSAGIVCQDSKRVNYGYSATSGIDPGMLRVYHDYYGKHDPQIPPISHIIPGRVYLGTELCAPERFRKTEYFNDFAIKYDISLYCAIPTSKTESSVEAVTLYTGFRDQTPCRETLDLVAFMVPHLQAALYLRRRFIDLSAQSSSFESALNLMEHGVVLLDPSGCVLNMNHSAESLMQRGDGLVFRQGRLYATSRTESTKLRETIERVVRTCDRKHQCPGGSLLISRNGMRPLSLTVAPLKPWAETSARRAVVVLFIYDPEIQVAPPEDLLRHGYGFTPAGARLSLLLIEGQSLTEAAQECGVTHNTARSQLRSIFEKTGVRHQGDLIRLLLRTHLAARSHLANIGLTSRQTFTRLYGD